MEAKNLNLSADILFSPINYKSLAREIAIEVLAGIESTQNKEAPEKLLAASQACEIFEPAITPITLRRWTSEGKLPVHQIGGRKYYKKSEIIASLQTLKKYKKSL